MTEYTIDPDGTAKVGPYGPVVAFFDTDGSIKATRYGTEIGFVFPDGTIKVSRYGANLGTVSSDGIVKDAQGRTVGTVKAPVHKHGPLLLILG